MNRRREKGLATVEFAIVGMLFLMLLFAVIEFGRAMFVWNTLNEATRRGARIAAVCPPGHSAVARIAVFSEAGGATTSPILPDLTTSHVTVRYLRADGTSASGGSEATETELVSVAIEGYRHTLWIPLHNATVTAPRFQTVLPRESLGVPNGCFGSMS